MRRRIGSPGGETRPLELDTVMLAANRWPAGYGSRPGRLAWRSGLRTFVIVGLSAIVPLVLLSLLFGYRASTEQRRTAEIQASMRIDSAASRLDSLLAAEAAAVQGVGGFRSVSAGDYPHLYQHLLLMPARYPEWRNIILVQDNGTRLIDLRFPLKETLPPLDPRQIPSETRRDNAMIGGLLPAGVIANGPAIAIAVRVRDKNDRRLLVMVALDPAVIEKLLDDAGLPADWRGVVLDQAGKVVARTANSPLRLGESADAGAGAQKSVDQTITLASKVKQAPWTMQYEIPAMLLDKPVNDAWWLMLLLGGGALGLAVLLASLVAADVAERRRLELDGAERRLQVSEAWRLLAVDAAAIGTWHWNAEYGSLQGCERCQQLLGVSRPSLPLRPLLALLFHPEGKAVVKSALQSYRAGCPYEREFRVRRTGGERWLQLYGRPLIDGQGRKIGAYGVLIDIDEQKRAEADHRALQGRLQSAQEEERLRIARDLHDRVGQSITGLSLVLKRLEGTQDSSERARVTADLKAMIAEISRDVHRAALELRPTALDDFGLAGAIQTYLRDWRQRVALSVETCFTGLDEARLPPLVETTAFRIVVELLTNIARHAEASAVSLTLTRRAELLTLVVEDDGRGMDHPPKETAPGRHLGLLGIRERLEIVGGEMRFETAPGGGTTVFVRVPLAPAPARAAA